MKTHCFAEIAEFTDNYSSESSAQNCHQKEAVLHPENNQIIYLTEREGWTGCGAPVDGMIHCETAQWFESVRERWWFIAVSRCGTTQVRHCCTKRFTVLLID